MRQLEYLLRVWLFGLAIATCFGASPVMIAQEQGPPPPPDGIQAPPDMQPPKMNVDKEVVKMTKRYSLTDSQESAIRPILVDQQQKFNAVFKDSSLAPEERFSKMRSIHDEQVSKISEILTESQRSKYQKDQKSMDQGPGPGGPPPPDGPGDGPPNL